ncbi:hypothetical protein [Fervidobacterium sp. 2310opik-2]|uniref:hypothetical protein n=1 Tax=Fervidobacterium sp. 2310opik-2 TaxID=1755815 RepID=UPI0013E060DE|nr:hypothetical protein [Fervidobacterium sp. 2310opik-2]KAF2961866.1 hypothetical protein AS161_07160 [Fervidobacterium sp. 2310opik-2]
MQVDKLVEKREKHVIARGDLARKRVEIGKGEYLFLILVGFITFVFGFISLAVYVGVMYLAPIVSNLTGLTFLDSRFLLFVLIAITVSGFFTSTYPFSKAIGGNASFHIILAFMISAAALGVQVYKLAFTGPTWIGIDLLGEHGNNIQMMYLSAIYFAYNLILLALQFTVLRKEFSHQE